MTKKILFFILILNSVSWAEFKMPYNLSQPTERIDLDSKLLEISSIDYYKKNKVVAVQDEIGKIYIYDIVSHKKFSGDKFTKKGDFEGVAFENQNLWILKSDGTLFLIKNFNKDASDAEEIETSFEKINDTEGLAYDPKKQRLLMSCKGSCNVGKVEINSGKAIYEFDIKTKKLNKNPAYLIKYADILNILSKAVLNEKEKEWLVKATAKSKDFGFFQPSELRVDPSGEYLYVLASVGKMVVVLNLKTSELVSVKLLNPEMFKQPEGLTFMPNKDLLISDEGKDGTANIFRFSAIKP